MIAFSACSDIKMVLNVGLNGKAVIHRSAVCIKHAHFDSPSVFVYLLDPFVPMKSVKNNTVYWTSSTFVIFFQKISVYCSCSPKCTAMEGTVRSPLGFFGLAFPAGCSGVAQGTVTRPERVSVWWGFPGGFLRLPRASRSDNFVIALTCVKAWVGQ